MMDLSILFKDFMNSMKGKNPNDLLNYMISSGQINQQQLNFAQQKAKEIEGQLNGFKGMFGFK